MIFYICQIHVQVGYIGNTFCSEKRNQKVFDILMIHEVF